MRSILFFLIFSSLSLMANSPSWLLESEKNSINVFQSTVNSVVYISNMKVARGGWLFGDTEVARGTGSGFIWDKQGHIVTNFHVVQGGDYFLVSFHKNSKQYKAKLIGAEPKKDTAVLKLEEIPQTLQPITAADSQTLLVGQKAIALGNPYGLDHTMTQGIISALDRKIETFDNVTIRGMVQTDASINPGNSGGPLLDSRGYVIGMNTVIFSQSGSSAGVGFAVPINTIKEIVPDLIKYGKVTRPGLGVGLLPDNYNEQFGIREGIAISYIDENGPAGKAGLQGMSMDRYGHYYLGDIIIQVGSVKIKTFDDIYHSLDNYKIGDTIDVTYLRKNKKFTVKVVLQGV